MACVELQLNNGILVSFDADISLSTNNVINYLKQNPNTEYTLNGELVQGNLYDFLISNLSERTTLNSNNLAETLVGNYKLTDTYPELETSDHNILKVSKKSFVTQSFFVSPNRIAAIANESNMDIVEKVFYVYEQIKSGNIAFATLVDELIPDDSNDVYAKFSKIVNEQDLEFRELIKHVPSKYSQELLTIGKDSYLLDKGVWKTIKGKEVENPTNLWNNYLKRPSSYPITPMKLSELRNYKIQSGDTFFTRSGNKLTFDGSNFIDELDNIVSDETSINRISIIRDNKINERELELRSPISYGRIRFVLDNYLSDYNVDAIKFGESEYIENGVVTLNENYPVDTPFARIAIPIILNHLTADQSMIELTNNGDVESLNTLLQALYDYYINGIGDALEEYDNVKTIDWIMGEIDKVLATGIDIIGEDSEEVLDNMSIEKVSDNTIKKLMEDGNLTIYCAL